MKDVILIANAGSSSLKISIFEIQNKKVKDKILFHINRKQASATDIKDDAIEMMIDLFEDWWKKQENLK